MKKKGILLLSALVLSGILTACGNDPALALFKNEFDAFCLNVSELDTAINSIDTSAENEDSVSEFLEYLNDLDAEFQTLAEIDFPKEFDYLESLADEASAYMTEAVTSYAKAYENDSYVESRAEYAKENYARACKRVQIIIAFLHGETPDDTDLKY